MPLNEGFVSFSSHLRICFPQTIVHTYIHRQTHSHTKPLVQTGKAWKEQACLVNQENDILGHFPHPTWRKPMIHHTTTGAEPSLGSIICHTSPLPGSSVVTPSFFFSVLSCSLCLSPSQEGFCRLKKKLQKYQHANIYKLVLNKSSFLWEESTICNFDCGCYHTFCPLFRSITCSLVLLWVHTSYKSRCS